MGMELRWNDTDRIKSKNSKKIVPLPLCSPQIPRGLSGNPGLRRERPATKKGKAVPLHAMEALGGEEV
jgi:hypothetical protein